MEDGYELVCVLSNGAICNDLEWHLTQISRSRYHTTSNNSNTVQDEVYSYNGTPIVSRIWSTDRRHFWMAL